MVLRQAFSGEASSTELTGNRLLVVHDSVNRS